MKKPLTRLLAILLATLLLGGAMPLFAMAATDVTNDFTDPNFRAAVRSALSLGPTASISDAQAASLTVLDASDRGITSLAGINRLTNLEVLFAPGNPDLTSLSISGNAALKEINVADCGLTSLNVSSLPELLTLICVGNQLTSLQISGLSKLQSLDCSYNGLTSLSVTNCPNMSVLACADNLLTSLDVSQFYGLGILNCSNNDLTSLSLANNLFLTSLICSGNDLNYLDVYNQTALQSLDCSSNNIISLDLTTNTNLITLNCADNQIIWVDVSLSKRLYGINCANNQLTDLNVTGLTQLRMLDVSINRMLSKSAIAGLPAIENDLYEFVFEPQVLSGTNITNKFTDPNLLAALRTAMGKDADALILQEECESITSLDLFDCGIQSLAGLEYFTNLQELQVAYNELTQLSLTLPKLKKLECYENQLTSIDLSGCPALEQLDCADNYLEQLSLTNNPALTDLDCSNNLLMSLVLTSNTNLKQLNCASNLMLGLDVRGNTQLRNVDVRRNYMADVSSLLLPPGGVTYLFNPQNTLDVDVSANFLDGKFLAAIRAELGKGPNDPVSAQDCRSITQLDVSSLGITSLVGIAFLTNLEYLDCSDNKLTAVDVSNNAALRYLDVRENWLPGQEAVTGVSGTTEYYYSPQKYSGEIITDQITDPAFLAAVREALGKDPDDPIGKLDCALLEELDLTGKGIKDAAGISLFTGLKKLDFSNNELTSLNLTPNIALETLDVSRNHLTELNLLANRNLSSVNATYNFMINQSVLRLPSPAPGAVSFNPQNSYTVVQPTCTAKGYGTWVCSHNPAHTLIVNETSALGHNYASVVTKATFSQGGYTTFTCTRCAHSYVGDHTDKITLTYNPTLNLQYHQATTVFSDADRLAPELQWHSSNEKVIRVDGNGLVTYAKRGAGETTITATANGVTYMSVKVTVKYAWWQWLIIILFFGWIWY